MRFIYILGILLLIAIGFLVYVYRDSLWGTIDGFQTATTTTTVFQLYESRCNTSADDILDVIYNVSSEGQPTYFTMLSDTDNSSTPTEFFPTMSKSTGILVCRAAGGRLSTYDELSQSIIGGLVIDSDKPAMVVDSNRLFKSVSSKITVADELTPAQIGYDAYNITHCAAQQWKVANPKNVPTGSESGHITYLEYDGHNSQHDPDAAPRINSLESGKIFYDLNGYTSTTSTYCIDNGWKNIDNILIKMRNPGSGAELNDRRTWVIKRNKFTRPKPTEVFGHPVCTFDSARASTLSDTIKLGFPQTKSGWSQFRNNRGGTRFYKNFNIRKPNGSLTGVNQCTTYEPINPNIQYTSIVDGFIVPPTPVISLNTPTPTTPQTSYNIIDLDTVYSQIDIAKIDLPKRRDTVVQSELTNIAGKTISETLTSEDYTPGSNEQQRRVYVGYSFIKKEMAASATQLINLSKDYETSMGTVMSYWNPLGAFISSNQNNTMTASQYSNILIKNINYYYNTLLLEFQLHPVAFLRKGVINFPSMLNSFKIYNFPTVSSLNFRMVGGLINQPVWEVSGGQKRLSCVDGLSNRDYTKGGIQDWDFRETSQTEQYHNPDGKWCSKYSTKLSPNCDWDYWGRTWRWGGCVKEYYRNESYVTDADYIIISQNQQNTYDINGPKYNRSIDSSWRAVKDTGSTNPVPTNVEPKRIIAVVGTISATNIIEIEKSISYAMCLNFTDTSRFESQIRISSDDLQLYMSPDASGLPEFKNTIDIANKTSTITPLNTDYNAIHCGIRMTPEIFYLLPFHTRNMIDHWATIRFARVKLWKDGTGSSVSLLDGSKPTAPIWNINPGAPSSTGTGGTTGAYISGFGTTASIKGSLFNTAITKEKRNAFFNSVARFYYENERANLGTDGGSSAIGYAVMHKIVDVFQVGNTIFDIRFEEYKKRGLQFQRKLEALESEYRSYKRMNLSKDDQLSLEENYLKQKTELYAKDDNYIWGQAQDCGVKAQYVVINSPNGLFHISQVVVINSAGQNVALGAQIYSPSPNNIDYGSIVDDPRTRVYYDEQTGNQLSVTPTTSGSDRLNPGNTLLATKTDTINSEKAAKEALLTDGTLTPRWPPSCYKTISVVPVLDSDGRVTLTNGTNVNGISYLGPGTDNYLQGTGGKYLYGTTVNTFTTIQTTAFTHSPLILDLGQLQNISVVQIILPAGVTATTSMYTVQLNENVLNQGSNTGLSMQNIGSPFTANATTTVSGSTIVYRYPGTGDDSSRCPDILYDRFKVARFYTDFAGIAADKPWTVRGYSVGIKAALTFDSKYNAGIAIDTTINGGTLVPAYKPDLSAGGGSGYNLNMGGGSPPPLNCLDPERIKTIFNEYNILVNSDSFRYNTRTRTAVIQNPDEIYTATVVKKGAQKDPNTCAYIWTDKVVSNTANTSGNSLLTNTGAPTTIERYGEFPYPLNTQDFASTERLLDLSAVGIVAVSGAMQTDPLFQNLPIGTGTGVIIPEMYPKSVTLDTANGFCPGLPCSDTQVMNSLLSIYNANLSVYGPNMPAISKIHKAITPNPYQCEFLVETVGSTVKRKVLFNVNVLIPNTMTEVDENGNGAPNTTCRWLAPPSYNNIDGTPVPGVTWDFAPDMVDSTPFLTRAYNYALDVMRPFSRRVTDVVNELTGLGSAQLDPAGSGIMNTLVKYRTETAAAAGDIRYFQNWEDEFGNQCVQPGSSGPSNSANYPRCRSATVLNSLYTYYSAMNSSGSTFSKIANMIRTGMTDDEKCDFTFEGLDYMLGQPNQSRTTGLRCEMRRLPFSCDFEVTTCAYINPEPPLSDIKAIPSEFVQSVWMGSGSDPTIHSGSNPPPITAAGLNASGSQSLEQPPNGPSLLRSIDYVDCTSKYGGNSTNTSLTTCANGRAYIKPAGSFIYVLPGWSPGILPTGITLLSSAPPLDTVKALVPYTIISSAGSLAAPANMFEYRITTSDKLDFGKTYIRAGFYTDSAALGTQLAYLVPANPLDSPNAFFAQARDYTALTNQFLSYWNRAFTKNKNVGNKIGTITGYSISRADDSITFKATSATFGELGPDDIQYYYPVAFYKVYFRIPYSGGSSPIMYKMEPTPKTFGSQGSSQGSPGPFTTISVSSGGGTPGGSTDDYIVQSPIQISVNQNKFRSFKFTVTKVAQDTANPPNSRTRAEIARINFWSMTTASTSGTPGSTPTFSAANINSAQVEVAGTYSNYTSKTGTCKPGYTAHTNSTNDTLIECIANTNQSYPAVSDGQGGYVACGIGYYGPIEYTSSSGQPEMRCVPTGYFQDVLNPAFINANMYVPRLRLDVNQTLTVDLNSIQRVDAFSFIIGSTYNRPLRWTLQGSINNIDWVYLYNQQTDFTYNVAAGEKYSFYDPGFFIFSPSTGSMPTSQLGSAPLAITQRPMQTQLAEETKEGFLNPDVTKKRMRHLRWKIMETQKPVAPYVHASMLQFHTKAGPIPADAIKISNPLGTRRKPTDAPTALLSGSIKQRWVDYNKSDLLIMLDLTKLPGNPIYGFQFAVPANVENSVDFVPARWVLEGSYDGRTWVVLHDKSDRARIMGDASPIYKFSQHI